MVPVILPTHGWILVELKIAVAELSTARMLSEIYGQILSSHWDKIDPSDDFKSFDDVHPSKIRKFSKLNEN